MEKFLNYINLKRKKQEEIFSSVIEFFSDYPSLLKRLILAKDSSKTEVVLYLNSKWRKITVKKNCLGKKETEILNDAWKMIKIVGNIDVEDVLQILTGMPVECIYHKVKTKNETTIKPEELISLLEKRLKDKVLIIGDSDFKEAYYKILEVNSSEKKVKIYNYFTKVEENILISKYFEDFYSTNILHFMENSYRKTFFKDYPVSDYDNRSDLYTLNVLASGKFIFEITFDKWSRLVHPATLVIAQYDGEKLINVFSKYKFRDNINIVLNLPVAKYIAWIFCYNKNMIRYFFHVTSMEDFNISYKGKDTEYKFISNCVLTYYNDKVKSKLVLGINFYEFTFDTSLIEGLFFVWWKNKIEGGAIAFDYRGSRVGFLLSEYEYFALLPNKCTLYIYFLPSEDPPSFDDLTENPILFGLTPKFEFPKNLLSILNDNKYSSSEPLKTLNIPILKKNSLLEKLKDQWILLSVSNTNEDEINSLVA